MSDTERQAIIGRTVEEHVAATRNHVALLAKAAELGHLLTTIGMYLKSTTSDGGLRQGRQLEVLSSMPAPDEIQKLVQETLDTQRREKELEQQLRDLGVRG